MFIVPDDKTSGNLMPAKGKVGQVGKENQDPTVLGGHKATSNPSAKKLEKIKTTANEALSPPDAPVNKPSALKHWKEALLSQKPHEIKALYETASGQFTEALQNLYMVMEENPQLESKALLAAHKLEASRLEAPLDLEKASTKDILNAALKLKSATALLKAEHKSIIKSKDTHEKALNDFVTSLKAATQEYEEGGSEVLVQALKEVSKTVLSEKPANSKVDSPKVLQEHTKALLSAKKVLDNAVITAKIDLLQHEKAYRKFNNTLEKAKETLEQHPDSELLSQAINAAEDLEMSYNEELVTSGESDHMSTADLLKKTQELNNMTHALKTAMNTL